MRRKITFLLTFLVAVLSIALAGGRVYADTGYEVEDYANQEMCIRDSTHPEHDG